MLRDCGPAWAVTSIGIICLDNVYTLCYITVMSKSPQNAKTRPQMNLRVANQDRALFDLAAQALGTTRSEFMLNASRKAAEEALMGRVLFPVDQSTWDEFRRILDAPHTNKKGLSKLKSAPIPWQE